MTMQCEFCKEPLFEVEDYRNHWIIPDCKCPTAKSERKRISDSNRPLRDEALKKLAEMKDMTEEEQVTYRSNDRIKAMEKKTRLSLMRHTVSSIDLDMIEDLYLDNAKIKIPKAYLWKIRVENPGLCLSDYIDHIWKLQSEGVDPVDGDVKLVVYPGRIWVDEKSWPTKRAFTAFSYPYFIKKAEATNNYKGFDVEEGIGDYFNPVTKEFTKELYAKCTVYRSDRRVATSYTAWLPEFIGKDKLGEIKKKWKENPKKLLRKSSVINSFKQSFPKELDLAIDFDSMEVESE